MQSGRMSALRTLLPLAGALGGFGLWAGFALPPVHADPAPAVSPSPAAACNGDGSCVQHVELAMQAAGRSDFVAAQQSYQAAYAVIPAPALLLRIGRCQHLSGHVADALHTFDELSARDAAVDAKTRELLLSYRAAAQATQIHSELDTRPIAAAATAPHALHTRWWVWAATGLAVSGLALGLGLAFAPQPQVGVAWAP